ncbi:MAG: Golgi apyrase [Sclerophora amabilis]|nr:MAG: Golgi apyrase [Sclerophora amabilis]
MEKWKYGVILDAGSSGTRAHVYRWLNGAKAGKEASPEQRKRLPELRTEKKWTKKIHPGISTFGEDPGLVGPDHLEPLFKHALDIIPKSAVKDTPLFLLATAGVRLLPEMQRNHLLAQVCSYARSTTDFLLPECDLHVQAISGETEGLYGWIAANYLLGGFDSPEQHAHGKGHHTYGFLDMGGASAQIAFAPNATEAERHGNDLKLLRMRTVDGTSLEYRVFVTTWLGFGVHEARRRYIDALLEQTAAPGIQELPDPCLPVTLNVTQKGEVIQPGSKEDQGREPHLIGTGKFEECLRRTQPLLEKDARCEDPPCLLSGVHVPAIDFDVNHFVGVSEYWHTTHEIFEMGHKDKSYDFNTYQHRVDEFCSQDWAAISKGIDAKRWGKKVNEQTAVEVCFKASWLINMLHNGIGIPRVGLEHTKSASSYNGTKEVIHNAKEKGFLDPFQAVDKIEGTEVSWTLGKMVLYAASQVPLEKESSLLPVGFGSNAAGIPKDFQYAGAGGNPISTVEATPSGPDGDWHATLLSTKSSRRIPGFILFLTIICIAVFLWCGRERRSRWTRRITSLFKRSGGSRRRGYFGSKIFGGNSPSLYDRVLENGDPANDFDLGDVDSENEHSDSSDDSRSRLGRASGWATPRLKVGFDQGSNGYFDNVNVASSPGVGLGLGLGIAGNAMDRSGLLMRTESREILDPPAPGSSVPMKNPPGMRSRTGSPSRKSPFMTQMSE